MTKSILLAATFSIFATILGLAQQPGLVKVESGWLRGISEDGLTVYLGVPFAAPPVGDLRWRSPLPVAKWDGVRRATQFGPMPVQGGKGSEDCLYLNVWTPAKSATNRLPVMVWIYGGGFAGGSTSDPWISGEMLAKKGVVFVSIAYRVGILGFLAHPELSAETTNHVSGNYGLLDQIAGLQWVKKNIVAFGGDPRKVTIFGESAGAISVSMLCASPLAKGLFEGAISQSGGSFGPPRPTTYPGENMKRLPDAERDGLAYAKGTYFDQHPDYPVGSPKTGYGSPHAQDVSYVFLHLNPNSPETTKSDLAISDAMSTYWVDFAKHGNPNNKRLPAWPAFSETNSQVMYFQQTPHLGPVPGAAGLKVLDEYFAWRRTPEGEAWAK